MIWQDFVFMIGSSLSIACLTPTLRDTTARIPLATSFPSMAIGSVYAFTFMTLGMTFSAVGALATCVMWTLISFFRAPESPYNHSNAIGSCNDRLELFVADAQHWLDQRRHRNDLQLDFYTADASATQFHLDAD